MPTDRTDATADDALGTDDATGLRARLDRREVSPAELREAALARTRSANGTLNAVVCWVDDREAEPALDADAPFAGIPTVIKDNEALQGYPTTEGSWATSPDPAQGSSPWVRQFLALGAQPIAKSTLPEFGLTATTESDRLGATVNPWSHERIVGGSSGGSAALVAAGAVPIAHANDGGGSIRIPASCCGLVGLKATRGRIIDIPELDRLPVNLVTQGVVTRSVRDTARYFAAAERLYLNPALPPIGHVTGPDPQRLRVGVITGGMRGLPVSDDSVAAVEGTARLLESLGHHIEATDLGLDNSFGPDFLRYWAMLAFLIQRTGKRLYGPGFDPARTTALTQGMARHFTRELERVPGSLRRLRRLARGPEANFDRFDVVLSPVLGHAPPPIGYLGPDVDPRTHMSRLLRFVSFTPAQNVTGGPALSLPLGRSGSGLPVGVQLSAPRGHEARLLGLAYELEEAAPWPTRVTGNPGAPTIGHTR